MSDKDDGPNPVPLPVGEYADQFPHTLQVSSLGAEPAPNGRDAILELEYLAQFDVVAYEQRQKVKRFVLSRPAAQRLYSQLQEILEKQ